MTAGAFITEHGVWSEEQSEAAARIRRGLESEEVRLIRLVWADQHGLARVKTITAAEFEQVLARGRPFQLAPMLMDTANRPAVSPFTSESSFGLEALRGLPDGVLVPDPLSFRSIPWSPENAWVLCDLHLQSGEPVPFCTRQLLGRLLDDAAADGLDFRVGLELEFCVTRLLDDRLDWSSSGHPPDPPAVAPLAHGYQYLGEAAIDDLDEVAKLVRRLAEELELPLRTIETEWGPSQLECTFSVLDAAAGADAALLFRGAVRQAARRAGFHASFMPRPQLANVNSSGWHLHQSLYRSGSNVFADADDPNGLSVEGRGFLAGLLVHASEMSLLVAPLVNSYKRFEPGSFAPWTACWTNETRGSLVRALGGGEPDHTRLEFRGGDPAANPYLYVAAQLVAGRDGIAHELDPGPPTGDPTATVAPPLPRGLPEAIDAFAGSELFRRALGGPFVDYLTTIKRHEVERFLASVTDWEQREYFRTF